MSVLLLLLLITAFGQDSAAQTFETNTFMTLSQSWSQPFPVHWSTFVIPVDPKIRSKRHLFRSVQPLESKGDDPTVLVYCIGIPAGLFVIILWCVWHTSAASRASRQPAGSTPDVEAIVPAVPAEENPPNSSPSSIWSTSVYFIMSVVSPSSRMHAVSAASTASNVQIVNSAFAASHSIQKVPAAGNKDPVWDCVLPVAPDPTWTNIWQASQLRQDFSYPCPICHEPFGQQTQVLLSCSHLFHQSCIATFEQKARSRQCPLCRAADYAKCCIPPDAYDDVHGKASRIQSAWRGHRARRLVAFLRWKEEKEFEQDQP